MMPSRGSLRAAGRAGGARRLHTFVADLVGGLTARVLPMVMIALGGCKEDPYAAERAFLAQPEAEQHAEFRKLPPERQVRVHLAAQSGEAIDLRFCKDFEESTGIEAVPAILTALADAEQDLEKHALLGSLDCARDHRAHTCDPRVSPIAVTVARSIYDKERRTEAVQAALRMRCAR